MMLKKNNPQAAATSAPDDACDVLVVGAGASGLAAAKMLSRAGFTCRLIEARPRIGGRVDTIAMGDCSIDMGAAWIHGPTGNPMASLAREIGAATFTTQWTSFAYADANGQPIPPDVVKRIRGKASRVMEALLRAREGAPVEADVEHGGNFAELVQAEAQSPIEARGIVAMLGFEIVNEHGASLHELSLRHFDEDDLLPGGDYLLPRGYGQLMQALAEGLDVRLSEPVHRVEAQDAGGVCVETSMSQHRARAAVVTLPLGVLQAGGVEFRPRLPDAMLEAMSRLRMGAYNKVAMRFARAFWPGDVQFLNRWRGPTHLGQIDYLSFIPINGAPVLVALFAGETARNSEQLDDEPLVRVILGDLRQMFGDRVEAPIEVKRTRWLNDPFARGAYSIVPPGADRALRQALAGDIAGQVFFAGEATHPLFPATVHGALLSGEACAKRVMEALKQT